jgi:hypothetical protein
MGRPRIVPKRFQGSFLENEQHFSLVLGGPLYQLYLHTGLARPPLQLVVRRTLTVSLICWLPLFLLTAVAGHLTAGTPVPFLRDPEVHIRFLVALPLLIGSEVLVHRRVRLIVRQFLVRGIIASHDQPRFEKLVASAMRLRNSLIAELVLLGLLLTLGHWVWSHEFALPISTWYAKADSSGRHLTAAGWFYAFISLTIFRFIIFRWYFRLFVWWRFLWQVRAMPLHLNLYHPDRAGGLGFLSGSPLTFAPVIASQTIVVAGIIFARILYAGEKLPDFKMEIAAVLIFCILLLVLPLGFFAAHLARAGRTARLELGALASHYVGDFRRKWIQSGVPAAEPLLGTPDIQSLADLANSFAVVSEIRLLPITLQAFVRVVTLVALPLLPLTLTMVPLEEAIQKLFQIVF